MAALPSPQRRVIVVGAMYEGQPLTDWSVFTMRQMAGIQPYEEFSMLVAITDAEWNHVYEDFDQHSRRWIDNDVVAFAGSATQEAIHGRSSASTSKSTPISEDINDRTTNASATTTSASSTATLSFSIDSNLENYLVSQGVQVHRSSEISPGDIDHNSFAMREMLTTLNEQHSHVTYIAPTTPTAPTSP